MITYRIPRPFSREELWAGIVNDNDVRTVLEIGVWKGDFAAAILSRCPRVETYWMIDPWRRLERWNKPFNVDDGAFEEVRREAMAKTEGAGARRRILRGTTTEVIGGIPDGSVDCVYVDGDHTLRGITIDLLSAWAKVRAGGILGGDDFSATAWQHGPDFEPSLVNPFALYFAEAMGVPITLLPGGQFFLHKDPAAGFRVDDRAGTGGDAGVRALVAASGPAGGGGWATPVARFSRPVRSALGGALKRLSPRAWEWCIRRRGGAPFPADVAEARCLLIHVPKTAGVSLSMALYGRSIGHRTLAEWQRLHPHSVTTVWKIAVVRDPVERFASAYAFLREGGMNAEDAEFHRRHLARFGSCGDLARAMIDPTLQEALLTQGYHFRRQVDFVRDVHGGIGVDFLIPYERLGEGVERVSRRIGRPLDLPLFNRTAAPRETVDAEARRVLESVYRDDVALWQRAREAF